MIKLDSWNLILPMLGHDLFGVRCFMVDDQAMVSDDFIE